eukprot:3412345-Amphidinium_carterae.1
MDLFYFARSLASRGASGMERLDPLAHFCEQLLKDLASGRIARSSCIAGAWCMGESPVWTATGRGAETHEWVLGTTQHRSRQKQTQSDIDIRIDSHNLK